MKKCGVLLIAGVLATLLTACERDDKQPQVYNDNSTTTTQPANGVQPTVTPPADTTTTTDTNAAQ